MDNGVVFGKVFTTAVDDLGLLLIFLLLGVLLLRVCKPLKKLYLPAGLIGGALALVLGPQVLGVIDIPKTWSGMATPMINVVLTTTIFGTIINKQKLKKYAGAVDLIFLTYFSQMIVGTLVGVGLSKIWKDMPYAWGMMAIFTYWGGHGAATTAGTLFEEMGNTGMLSLGIIMATLGLIVAMLAGMVWVNIGVRKGWASYSKVNSGTKEGSNILLPDSEKKSLGLATVSSDVVNGLALQLAIVLLCMFTGKMLFTTLAKVPVAPIANVMGKIPALLYGIVGSIIVWFVMRKTHTDGYADITTIKNIGGVALEICVCSATATLDLEMFASYLAPILIHMVCIIALMSFLTMFLLRRWMKKDWFELGLMAFGQGHGSTPSGLALARCVDPDSKSINWEAFGVAMGVTTPFTSTFAAILPPVAMQSQWIIVAIGGAVSLALILFGELVVRRQN
ncbi:MAG: hypothetical protein J5969_06565 [Lachnospiraceae bacterium]|nr:hypothetical protein [Lachnospiraceae bacterium]